MGIIRNFLKHYKNKNMKNKVKTITEKVPQIVTLPDGLYVVQVENGEATFDVVRS